MWVAHFCKSVEHFHNVEFDKDSSMDLAFGGRGWRQGFNSLFFWDGVGGWGVVQGPEDPDFTKQKPVKTFVREKSISAYDSAFLCWKVFYLFAFLQSVFI